jgi:uncharacterized protein
MENSQMQPQARARQLTPEDAARIQGQFMTRVYGWMFAALLITGGVALFASTSEAVLQLVFGNRLVFFGLIIAELVIVGFLSARALTWTPAQVTAAFIGYSVLNGLTLSVIFLVYTADSIASTFFISGLTFGVMSLYGYVTKTDLSKWGNLLFMGLIGIVIASVVNMFWHNSTLSMIVSYVGVLLFVALTAYDTQKVKQYAFIGLSEGEDADHGASVLGALTLYLDFINLFLFLLRIFGRRR